MLQNFVSDITKTVFDIKDISSGGYILRSTVLNSQNKEMGNFSYRKFNWPKKKSWGSEYANQAKVLNNFVSELYSAKQLRIANSTKIKFTNPREGWVYIKSIRSSAPITITLDAQQTKILDLTLRKSSNETMRFLTEGKHFITIHTTDNAILENLVIRTMPEIVLCEYQTRPDGGYRKRIWNGMQTLLKVCNVTMESFVRAGKTDHYKEIISSEELKRIKTWRAAGRKSIVQIPIPGFTTKSIPHKQTYNYWTNSIGMTTFDGISIDEFGNETPKELTFCNEAVKRINAERKFDSKRLYAYCCPAWDTHKQSIEFRKSLIAGNHFYAPELYLREQKTLNEAKKNIIFMFRYLEEWEKTYPGSISNMLVTLCCTTLGEQGYYRQDTFANVDFKVYYDLQMNYMANAPSFFNVGGITSWVIRYSNTETILWLAALYKHYCIDGKKNLLSEEYGYVYELPYIKNPDFTSGLKFWDISPARENSIKMQQLPGWGFARGACNKKPDGDDFVVLDIDSQKPNCVSQKIKNLIPGKLYSAEMYSADYQDIIAGKRKKKFNSISLKIEGAEIIKNLSYVKKFQSDHNIAVLFPRGKRNNGPCLNYHYVIFKALTHDAKISIIDRPSKSVADDVFPQKQVLFNFVQIQPYFTLNKSN